MSDRRGNDEAKTVRQAVERYAEAFAAAIADDFLVHGPKSRLERAIIRWFPDTEELALTVHLLADADTPPRRGDGWFPLEWANAHRESQRTSRLSGTPRLAEHETELRTQAEETGVQFDDLAVDVAEETARRLRKTLARADVMISPALAVTATHFEGWGGLSILHETTPADVVEDLTRAGDLPPA